MKEQSNETDTGFHSIATLVKKTNLSRVTLWREMKAGRFPNAIRISPRRVGVPIAAYRAWEASRAKADGREWSAS